MNNLHFLLHKIKLHRFHPNGDIQVVTFLESVKELWVGFSVGSVMIWTIRFHLFPVLKCLDMQDKYEQSCSFSFLGWRIFSFLKSGVHDQVSYVEMFLFTWGVVRCCSPVDLNVFSSWKCLCWGGYPGTHVFALVFCLGSLSALSYHIFGFYRNAECRFVQFRSPSAAFVSSHMIFSNQLQNVLFHPSDTYRTNPGFIWRNLNSEPLWIFVSDVSWHGVVWSSWSRFSSSWLSEESFHHWLCQWCFPESWHTVLASSEGSFFKWRKWF